MPFKELGIDMILSRRNERGVLYRQEVLCIVILADISFEAAREDDALVIGEANETLVKGLVV